MERGDLNNCQTQKSLVKHPYTKNSLLKATLNSYKLRTVQFVVLINTKYVFNKNDEKKTKHVTLDNFIHNSTLSTYGSDNILGTKPLCPSTNATIRVSEFRVEIQM